MLCRVQPGTRQRGAPPWRAADAEVTLFCRARPKTHGRHSAVSCWHGHTADILCRRCHCRDQSTVSKSWSAVSMAHTAEAWIPVVEVEDPAVAEPLLPARGGRPGGCSRCPMPPSVQGSSLADGMQLVDSVTLWTQVIFCLALLLS
jgi:hypothetical protein